MTFVSKLIDYSGAGPLAIMTAAFVAAMCWKKNDSYSVSFASKFTKLYLYSFTLLFYYSYFLNFNYICFTMFSKPIITSTSVLFSLELLINNNVKETLIRKYLPGVVKPNNDNINNNK